VIGVIGDNVDCIDELWCVVDDPLVVIADIGPRAKVPAGRGRAARYV